VSASKTALAPVKYVTTATELELAQLRRSSFDAACVMRYADAEAALQTAKNKATENNVQGWLGWQLAEVKNFTNPVEAQTLLQSSTALNIQIPVRSLAGIDYTRIGKDAKGQAERCLEYLRRQFSTENELVVMVNAILDDLEFRPNSANRFETALAELAPIIGFESQRPEVSFGAGPDVLWSLGEANYWTIECKNEAIVATIS